MLLPQYLPKWPFLDRAYRLPWWVAVLGALLAYLFFHPAASLRPLAAPAGFFDSLIFGLTRTLSWLAALAQYLIPAVLLSLAAINGFLQAKASYLRARLFSAGTALRHLSREEAGFLLAMQLHARGFRIRGTGEALRRIGLDLELIDQTGRRHLVHLGDWRVSKLGLDAIRARYKQMQALRRDGFWVLISGRFSPEALAFSASRPLRLIDGKAFQSTLLDPPASWIAQWLRRIRPFFAQKPQLPLRRWKSPPKPAEPREETAAVSAPVPDIAPIRAERRPVPEGPEVIFDPLIKLGRVLDWVGMGFSLALAWFGYQWFNSLPAEAAQDPWARLGTALPAGPPATSSTQEKIRTTLLADPPGQLGRYEPEPPAPEILEDSAPVIEQIAEQPIAAEAKPRSLRELEEAFNDRYVPPAACFDPSAPDSLARCGNHRMRAYRAFIASNGKTMVPSAPQPAAPAPSVEPFPIDAQQAPIPDWRRSGSYSPSWREEQAWREQTTPDDWGTTDWDRPVPDWRQQWLRRP